MLSGEATTQSRHFPPGTHNVSIVKVSGIRTDLLQNIAPIIEKSIADGNYPGAIVLAAHRGHIIYRGVFGNRRIVPNIAPMRFNTLFDLASLTKVIATTPAIMQLVEQGKLDIDAPVAKYWPAFAENGKETITIRELLTHTSGLAPDFPASIGQPKNPYSIYLWHGETEALQQVKQTKLFHLPGTAFVYSDINFIVLAYLVEVITGEHFNQYARTHIFKPLGMNDTLFLPPASLRDRIAPTEIMDNKLRWGEVHDPSAFAMGGVAGNAGLFSDASDLAVYAQCLLNGGRFPHKNGKSLSSHLLGPLTIAKMTTPETPTTISDTRGLGWDIDSPYSNRGILFPMSSFGHTGWTGTSIWIDPVTQTWLIILTSRTHPIPANNNQLIQDRRVIANIVSASMTDNSLSIQHNTGQGELNRAYTAPTHYEKQIATTTVNKKLVRL